MPEDLASCYGKNSDSNVNCVKFKEGFICVASMASQFFLVSRRHFHEGWEIGSLNDYRGKGSFTDFGHKLFRKRHLKQRFRRALGFFEKWS